MPYKAFKILKKIQDNKIRLTNYMILYFKNKFKSTFCSETLTAETETFRLKTETSRPRPQPFESFNFGILVLKKNPFIRNAVWHRDIRLRQASRHCSSLLVALMPLLACFRFWKMSVVAEQHSGEVVWVASIHTLCTCQ